LNRAQGFFQNLADVFVASIGGDKVGLRLRGGLKGAKKLTNQDQHCRYRKR